ncbi:MAG: hypothetical protein WD069_11110 [Planctomycetales bacterium]
MTNSTRGDLLAAIGELSELSPELRLGQLIANLATLARGAKVEAVWDAEDDELLAAAESLRERLRERSDSVIR